MSLIDLKKSNDGKIRKKKFTIDEFIDDADNYARGGPEIVSRDSDKKLNLEKVLTASKKHVEHKQNDNHQKQTFRHATFTLSEDTIEQLKALAIDSQLAKSHIIRILIDDLCNKDKQAKLQKLLGSNVG